MIQESHPFGENARVFLELSRDSNKRLAYDEKKNQFHAATIEESAKRGFASSPRKVAQALRKNQEKLISIAKKKWKAKEIDEIRNLQNVINLVFGWAGERPVDLYQSQYENWMRDLPEDMKNIDIRKFVLPGTHDSAASSAHFENPIQGGRTFIYAFVNFLARKVSFLGKIISGWTITQHLSIEDQLKSGIRFFDFRVSYNEKDNKFYLSHNFTCITLEEALKQIRKFMDAHKEEIIEISMKADIENVKSITEETVPTHKLSIREKIKKTFQEFKKRFERKKVKNKPPEDKEAKVKVYPKEARVIEQFNKELGNLLVKNDTEDLSINHLVESNQRVIVYYYGEGDKIDERYENIVKYGQFHLEWPEKVSNLSDFKTRLFSKLDHHAQHQDDNDKKKMHILPLAFTPTVKTMVRGIFQNNLATYAKEANGILLEMLKTKEEQLKHVQGLVVDFPEEDFVHHVVEFNKSIHYRKSFFTDF